MRSASRLLPGTIAGVYATAAIIVYPAVRAWVRALPCQHYFLEPGYGRWLAELAMEDCWPEPGTLPARFLDEPEPGAMSWGEACGAFIPHDAREGVRFCIVALRERGAEIFREWAAWAARAEHVDLAARQLRQLGDLIDGDIRDIMSRIDLGEEVAGC